VLRPGFFEPFPHGSSGLLEVIRPWKKIVNRWVGETMRRVCAGKPKSKSENWENKKRKSVSIRG